MDAFQPKQYNGAPSTWLVRSFEHALKLGARKDVDIVIWDRPELRQDHLDLYENKDALEEWVYRTGGYKRYVGREIVLNAQGVPVSVKVDHEDFIDRLQAKSPKLMWDNLLATTGLVSTLTGNSTSQGRPFRQAPGQDISKSSSATVNFHHHYSADAGGSQLTAHFSLTDSGLRFALNKNALNFKLPSGQSNFIPASEMPADTKFYDSTAGQIVLFKPYVLHVTSPEGIHTGRYAEAAYETYAKGVEFKP